MVLWKKVDKLMSHTEREKERLKSEIRISKFETKGNVPNSNDKNSETRMLGDVERQIRNTKHEI
jgi:hypothetical protein